MGKSLTLKINENYISDSPKMVLNNTQIMITPPIDEDYWVLKVSVSKTQSIVAFPKFLTIGIGFQKEDDWNTNLPYSCEAEKIFNHISHNKGDDNIKDSNCVKAIQIIKDFIDNKNEVK